MQVVMDFHAHLNMNEVIGLLAGECDEERRLIRSAAFAVKLDTAFAVASDCCAVSLSMCCVMLQEVSSCTANNAGLHNAVSPANVMYSGTRHGSLHFELLHSSAGGLPEVTHVVLALFVVTAKVPCVL